MWGLMDTTLQQKGVPSKFYRQATIGLLFIKMSKVTSSNVADVRGWGNQPQGISEGGFILVLWADLDLIIPAEPI